MSGSGWVGVDTYVFALLIGTLDCDCVVNNYNICFAST